jgi:Metal-dependent hydrolase
MGLVRQISKLGPDILCIQELFHYDMQHKFYSLLRDQYPHIAGIAEKGFKPRLGNELLILSKFPLAKGNLTRFRYAAPEERLFTSKGFYSVIADIPGAQPVQLINFHMTAGGVRRHPESPRMEQLRTLQIRQLLDSLNGALPALLAGDLNAGRETSRTNYEEITGRGFMDAYLGCGGTGMSWDPANPLVKNNAEQHLPAQRIDHIFLDQRAAEFLMPDKGRIVMNEACVGLTDGQNVPVSDHYGVLIEFNIRN